MLARVSGGYWRFRIALTRLSKVAPGGQVAGGTAEPAQLHAATRERSPTRISASALNAEVYSDRIESRGSATSTIQLDFDCEFIRARGTSGSKGCLVWPKWSYRLLVGAIGRWTCGTTYDIADAVVAVTTVRPRGTPNCGDIFLGSISSLADQCPPFI